MKEINWNIFKAKFNGKETCSFESLAYQLFCSEHGNRIGIFRFKNQIGIETEPIEVYGKLIGFQAKFYDTKILDNKYDIIDSLKKAKRENSNLNSVLFYLNQEFSESSTKGKKDPEYKTELETKAKKLNLTIEWRVPSHFERQLALPENHYLAEFFFEQGKGMVDFLVEIKKHTENLLHSIQTDILYGDQTIKIDRSSEISALESWVGNSSALIVSGEGGCGKTAIIKELFIQLSQSIPFYGFKAAEFNLPHIKALFSNYGKYSLNDFIQSHSEESRKIVLIDSAEKISDLDNQEPLKEFLIELLKNSWTVIFTTRLSYLDDLRFQFLSIFRLSFQEITINNLSPRELESLAVQYSFELPSNKKLKSLIQNPFYLDEYLDNYTADGNLSSYAQFKESIWLRKIQRSSFTKNNTHILRERCFLNIVKSRTEQGTFFVSANNCNEDILALLRDDEIIGFDRNSGGYFITHDIYEEWGQNILIERAYHARTEYVDFLKEIGNSLSIRRAFRNWLSGKLYDGIDEIKSFIESSFTSDSIEPFWKDEILTSVLLSDYAHAFFTQFKEFILADKHTILKKVIFLLRISCKEIDDSYLKILGIEDEINLNYIFTKPKGSGWSRVVNLVFENRNSFELDSLHYIFPILQEWSSYNKTGQTTRQVGLLALKYYNTIQSHEDLAYDSDVIDELVKVIIHSTVEIRDELVKIFDAVLEKGEIKRKELNYDLCKILVSSDNDIMPVIIGLPDYVLRFADLFWYDTGRDRYQYDRMGVESYYAISSGRDYSPASAEQTPIYWLLYSYYKRTVDFIIDFTNRTIKAYADSGFDDSVEEVELTLSSGKRKKQYLSHSLWNMYRGSGSSVTPDLLQSIHMALEKILLGMAEKQDRKSMESKLIYLIENSDSASISSVVASVVIANPDKFYNVAKILFSSSSFILQDRIRSLSGEREAESINSFGFGLDYKTKRFEDERAETFKQKHRSNSLEGLIINYQFFKDEHTTDQEAEDRKNELWEIIDKLHKTLPAKSKETENDKNLRLLLAGIDRRKMNPKLERQGDKVLIDFNPEIEPDLQKHKEQALEQTSELMKYTPLNLWAENKFNQRNSNNDYQQYESNPALVLKETREIVKGYDSNQNLNYFRFSKAIPHIPVPC